MLFTCEGLFQSEGPDVEYFYSALSSILHLTPEVFVV
jgi:hypothetical protein